MLSLQNNLGKCGKGALKVVSMAAVLMLSLTGCELAQLAIHATKAVTNPEKKQVKTASVEQAKKPAKATPHRKIGKPYTINGVWYYPKEDPTYDETGIASWYGSAFHGKVTANGERYDMNTMTAAHKTLPMPSIVEVTNLENGRVLRLRVNDRGPFVQGRIIDVSRRAAEMLGFRNKGTARVRVRLAGAAPLKDGGKVQIVSAKPFQANPQIFNDFPSS